MRWPSSYGFWPYFDVLALDAMGVVYEAGDDVEDLLIPFVAANGGSTDADFIHSRYIDASLGNIRSEEFWSSVGLSNALEDHYLGLHRLSGGLVEALNAISARGVEVCCFSNDVSEWSLKLRHRPGLETRTARWFIGGSSGVRKPDDRIYKAALSTFSRTPERILFVDDRVRNLDAARRLGMTTIWVADASAVRSDHMRVATVRELATRLPDILTARDNSRQ